MADLPGGISPHELEVFLSLAEDAHFGRAARRLYLSQPYVSRTLAAFERKVGGQLVDRAGHRLTPLGETVLAELRPAYDDLAAALQRVREHAGGLARPLRLGCTNAVSPGTVDALRVAYAERTSGGALEVVEAFPVSPHAAVRSGEFDAFLWWQEFPSPDFEWGSAVEVQRPVAAMRAGHAVARRAEISLEEVADHTVRLPEFVDPPHAAIIFPFPVVSPSGRPIRRGPSRPGYLGRAAYGLAGSDDLFVVSEGVARAFAHRDDLCFSLITDAPPYHLAPMWLRDRVDERVHALAAAAAALSMSDGHQDQHRRAVPPEPPAS